MEEQNRASIEKRYIWYQVFRNFWFVGAIWLLYYRLFITDQQVGVLDALAFGVGLLAEIPAGALADRFGRKKLIIIGVLADSVGMILQGMAHNYAFILIGNVLLTSGWALCSGADTSLFYDALQYDPDNNKWKKLVVKGGQAGLAATLAGYLVGGYLFGLSPRLPFLLSGVVMLGAIPVIWTMYEPKRSGKKQALLAHARDIMDGVKQLGHPQVIRYVPLILTLQGLFYSFGFGLLRPILQTRFGFQASGGAWVLFACGILTFILQRLQHKYIDRVSEKTAVTGIISLTVCALVAGCFSIGHVGFLVIAVLYASEYLLEPWISDGINKHVSSTHRATTLSAAAFLKALPYVIVAPLIGYLNVHGKLHYYLIGIALLSLAALAQYLFNLTKYESGPQ